MSRRVPCTYVPLGHGVLVLLSHVRAQGINNCRLGYNCDLVSCLDSERCDDLCHCNQGWSYRVGD